MRTFSAGVGRVHQLRYQPDGQCLVVDLRGNPTRHPFMGFNTRPGRELVWFDWVSGQPVRRFRLRDALYGPGGALFSAEHGDEGGDRTPDEPALEVSFCFNPWRIATAWEWTNKEDGNCVFDADARTCIYLATPYKTHTMGLALAPDGTALAAATVNNMDGSARLECWSLTPRERPHDAPGRSGMRDARIRAEREDAVALSVAPDTLVFDGRFIVAAGPGTPDVQCWDTQSPAAPMKAALEEGDPGFEYDSVRHAELLAPEFAPCALALGGAEHLLAIGGDGLVVWNAGRRKPVCSAPVDAALTVLAFDERAERLVAGTVSGTLELWDVAAGCRLRSLDCGIGSITAVAFSPDGLTCAAGGADGQVVVWDVDL